MKNNRSRPINWNESPIKIAEESIISFKEKSEHNKSEAMFVLLAAIAFSLLTPVSIAIGGNVWFEKILPTLFPAIAAFCTLWFQTRKPQIQWVIYRRQQREIEWELLKYNQEVEEYEGPVNKDKILTKNLITIFKNSHEEWASNIPDSIPATPK